MGEDWLLTVREERVNVVSTANRILKSRREQYIAIESHAYKNGNTNPHHKGVNVVNFPNDFAG